MFKRRGEPSSVVKILIFRFLDNFEVEWAEFPTSQSGESCRFVFNRLSRYCGLFPSWICVLTIGPDGGVIGDESPSNEVDSTSKRLLSVEVDALLKEDEVVNAEDNTGR